MACFLMLFLPCSPVVYVNSECFDDVSENGGTSKVCTLFSSYMRIFCMS